VRGPPAIRPLKRKDKPCHGANGCRWILVARPAGARTLRVAPARVMLKACMILIALSCPAPSAAERSRARHRSAASGFKLAEFVSRSDTPQALSWSAVQAPGGFPVDPTGRRRADYVVQCGEIQDGSAMPVSLTSRRGPFNTMTPARTVSYPGMTHG